MSFSVVLSEDPCSSYPCCSFWFAYPHSWGAHYLTIRLFPPREAPPDPTSASYTSHHYQPHPVQTLEVNPPLSPQEVLLEI